MAVNTSYKTATSTDYRDLLNDLVVFATQEQVNTAAINTAGTGYAAGDIVTVSGGTVTGGIAATIRVDTVSAGVPQTISVWNAGSYATNPGTTNISTTGGTGTGLTVDLTYQNPWSQDRKLIQQGVINAVIVAGGTGYTVNDTLTVSGGTFVTAATLNVDSVSGGVITGVSVVTNGEYTAQPTNPVSVTGGTGSSATFTLTFDGDNSEDQYLLTGIGSGSDNIRIGIRTFQNVGANAHNWELAGMTGRDNTKTWTEQPDISPGRYDALITSKEGGCFVPLANSTITWWFNVTGRRILMVAKISTTYSSMYMGFIQPLGTLSELPYPLLVGGCAAQPDTRFSTIRESFGSVSFPIGKAFLTSVTDPGDLKNGPMLLRDGSGIWRSFLNSFETASGTSSSTVYNIHGVTPPGPTISDTTEPPENDSWIQSVSLTLSWQDMAELSTADSLTYEMRVTPDTGGDLSPLFPQALILRGNSSISLKTTVFGEIDGFKWAPIFGTTLVAEDTVTVGNIVHLIFQSGLKTEPYHFFAMETR